MSLIMNTPLIDSIVKVEDDLKMLNLCELE